MSTAHEPLAMYLHLARASQRRQQPLVRDKLLILAGVVAAERGLEQVAACCRHRVLEHNAAHLIGQYATFAEALDDERFQTYLRKLRRDFPLEKAEHMLCTLGIELAGERETYYTDHEYAASLLGISTEELDQRFGEQRLRDSRSPARSLVETTCLGDGKHSSPSRVPILLGGVAVALCVVIVLLIARWVVG